MIMNEIQCPLCFSNSTKNFFIKQIDQNDEQYPPQIRERFKNIEFIHYKCTSCDFVFLPHPNDLVLSAYYDVDYYQHHFCLSGVRKRQLMEFEMRLEEFLSYIKGKKILDVGCGLGYSLEAYSKKNMEAYGMESSAFAVEAAKKNTKFDVIQHSIEDKTIWKENFFDAVTLHDVFEHLSQPISALNEVNRILKVNGIIYIHTLNWAGLGRKLDGLNWPLLNPPAHLSYWTPKTLVYALKKTGFSIIKLECPTIISKHRSIQIFYCQLEKRFPKFAKIIALLKLGDLIKVIAMKTNNNF
jgi:2-polyprenyl-3-methyl-5-hydroxy-6-metoxy-1,4-benzoquinol methylase